MKELAKAAGNEYGSLVDDGIFGVLTDGAVKRMQRFLGVRADGIIGPKTRAAINHSCGAKEEPQPQQEEVKTCPVFTQYYKQGSVGGEIPKIQEFLKSNGFYAGEINSQMDNKTLSAIKAFQTKYFDDILKPWGIKKATGRWYKSTRRKANILSGCQVDAVVLDNGVTLR
jgi:peptidoglycan hydrolase-like protein with peptidoglycan-binding domain